MTYCNSYASALESYVNNYGVATEGDRFDMFKSGASNAGRTIIDAVKRLFEMLRNAAARMIARIKDAIFRAKNRIKNKASKPASKEAAAADARHIAVAKKLIGSLRGAVPKYNTLIRSVVTASKTDDPNVYKDKLNRIEDGITKVNNAIAGSVNVAITCSAGDLIKLFTDQKISELISKIKGFANTNPHMYVQLCSEMSDLYGKIMSTCDTAKSLADSFSKNTSEGPQMKECARVLNTVGIDLKSIVASLSKTINDSKSDGTTTGNTAVFNSKTQKWEMV